MLTALLFPTWVIWIIMVTVSHLFLWDNHFHDRAAVWRDARSTLGFLSILPTLWFYLFFPKILLMQFTSSRKPDIGYKGSCKLVFRHIQWRIRWHQVIFKIFHAVILHKTHWKILPRKWLKFPFKVWNYSQSDWLKCFLVLFISYINSVYMGFGLLAWKKNNTHLITLFMTKEKGYECLCWYLTLVSKMIIW